MLQDIKHFSLRAEHNQSLFTGETWRVWAPGVPVELKDQFEWRQDNTLWVGFRNLSSLPEIPIRAPWETSLSLAARALGQRLGFDGYTWRPLEETPPNKTLSFISFQNKTPDYRPSRLHVCLHAAWTETGQGMGDVRFPWSTLKSHRLPPLGTQIQGYQVLHKEVQREEGWLRLAWVSKQPRQETWSLNIFCAEASGQSRTWEIDLGCIHGKPWHPNVSYPADSILLFGGQSWRSKKAIEPSSFFDPTLFEPWIMTNASYFETLFTKEEFWVFLWNRFYGTQIWEAEVPPHTEVSLGDSTIQGIVSKIQDIYLAQSHRKKVQILKLHPAPPFPAFSWPSPSPAVDSEGPLLWALEKEKSRLKIWLRPNRPRIPLTHTIEHTLHV